MSLRSYFNSIEPHFGRGGKYEKYYPIFEMVETIFFTSNTVTKVAPHARSFVDMKRVMTYVVISTIPCILWALYNTGFQTNTALASVGSSGGNRLENCSFKINRTWTRSTKPFI